MPMKVIPSLVVYLKETTQNSGKAYSVVCILRGIVQQEGAILLKL